MTHYAHMYSINRLRLAVRLGCLPPERANPQPVDVFLRLYFPKVPACYGDDNGAFIDYDALAKLIAGASSGEYRLVEFLAGEIYRALRPFIDKQDKAVKIWLKVTKCHPPVAQLEDGVSYLVSDLPAEATFVAGE